jgi:hypothetical protein
MVETMGTETRDSAAHGPSAHAEVDVLTLVPIVAVESWVSVCVTVVMMGEVATETSEAQTMAAKNNMQGKARFRKVGRIARAITSNMEGVEPRSFTPEQASCKKEKTLTVQRGRFTCLHRCGCLPSSHKYDMTRDT